VYSTDLAYIHDAGFGNFAKAVAPEIERILRRAGIESGRVVEFGCGSGTVVRHLQDCGYEVRAFDVSPAMIRRARKNVPRGTFSVASLSSARLPPCDALVGVGEVVTYVPRGLPALRRFFARAHAALRPGGVLIFDFMESARRRTYDTKTLKGSDWMIAVRATFDARRHVLTRSMTMTRRTSRGRRRAREIHRIRVYDRRAIRRLLEQRGFVVSTSRSYGRYRLLPGDVAVIARKRGRYNRVP
jgi:SAM-dependent methyltransferase